ncbi:MAG: hypothetical protein ACK45C_00470, partial [Bacteroidota bacterium]
LSVAAYYALVILLFALFPFRKPIIQTVQSLFIVVQALLIAIDIHLLQTWNSRFNQLALTMLQFPEATLQSLSTAQRWMIGAFVMIIGILVYLLAKALTILLNKQQPQFKPSVWILVAVVPM